MKVAGFSGYRVGKHRGNMLQRRNKDQLISPAEKDLVVMMEVKLIMSQQCAPITKGENCILGYIRNAVSKVKEVILP